MTPYDRQTPRNSDHQWRITAYNGLRHNAGTRAMCWGRTCYGFTHILSVSEYFTTSPNAAHCTGFALGVHGALGAPRVGAAHRALMAAAAGPRPGAGHSCRSAAVLLRNRWRSIWGSGRKHSVAGERLQESYGQMAAGWRVSCLAAAASDAADERDVGAVQRERGDKGGERGNGEWEEGREGDRGKGVEGEIELVKGGKEGRGGSVLGLCCILFTVTTYTLLKFWTTY